MCVDVGCQVPHGRLHGIGFLRFDHTKLELLGEELTEFMPKRDSVQFVVDGFAVKDLEVQQAVKVLVEADAWSDSDKIYMANNPSET